MGHGIHFLCHQPCVAVIRGAPYLRALWLWYPEDTSPLPGTGLKESGTEQFVVPGELLMATTPNGLSLLWWQS